MEDILRAIPTVRLFCLSTKSWKSAKTEPPVVVQIRAEEPQFEGHYPGNPIMPGVLCEACFQTGAIYLAKQIGKEDALSTT